MLFLLGAMRFDVPNFHQYAFLVESVHLLPDQHPQVGVLHFWLSSPQRINDPIAVNTHHSRPDSFPEETQEGHQLSSFFCAESQARHPTFHTSHAWTPSSRSSYTTNHPQALHLPDDSQQETISGVVTEAFFLAAAPTLLFVRPACVENSLLRPSSFHGPAFSSHSGESLAWLEPHAFLQLLTHVLCCPLLSMGHPGLFQKPLRHVLLADHSHVHRHLSYQKARCATGATWPHCGREASC